MRGRLAVLLSILLVAGFAVGLLCLRPPGTAAVSIRTETAGRRPFTPYAEAPYAEELPSRAMPESPSDERVNVNAASAAELQRLPGIGEKLAEAIVAYRTEHGPFSSREELMNVPGVGQARYEALADRITLEETP